MRRRPNPRSRCRHRSCSLSPCSLSRCSLHSRCHRSCSHSRRSSSPRPTSRTATPAPPAPSRGLGAGAIIGITLAAVLVVAGLGIGGFFAWRAFSAKDEPTDTPVAVDETSEPGDELPPDPPAAPSGFATAEEAVADYSPQDWVFDILTDEGDIKEYVIGPPNSEYSDVVVVAKQPDGSWLVEDSYPFDVGSIEDDSGDSAMSPEDEATQVVGEFLYAVKEDRADDAHAYTISPFAEDPASAQFSNGDLLSIEVTDAQLQSDGSTVWVWSKEKWAWGTESYIYVCVPTNAGYRINELRTP